MYLLLRTIVTAITIFSFTAQTALACGKERWPVKVGTDAGAVSVNLKSRKATIAILGDIPTPSHPEKHLAWRYPLETKTYSIEGTIVLIKKEEDEDYHVVIKDGARTMIV
ncbi:MAG: hypothetical protein IT556_10400, partial [Acetobacteraceae bacterium]|nr:hypothetical protein [Acetobacteraceae bacterium]